MPPCDPPAPPAPASPRPPAAGGSSTAQAATSGQAGAIVLDNASVRYQGAYVLRNVSARFATGQRWAVVGANGCGKSTLLKTAMRLLPCESGSVKWQRLQRQDIAYLPQQSGIDRSLPVLAQDLVALGLWHELRWWRRLNRLQQARVHAALEQVGMLPFARQPIAALSNGQFQRVLFARLLVQQARLLLLDEPFNAVDAATTAGLLDILNQCARDGAGIVAVVHDMEQARAHFDHILRLDGAPSGADGGATARAPQQPTPMTTARAAAPMPAHAVQPHGNMPAPGVGCGCARSANSRD